MARVQTSRRGGLGGLIAVLALVVVVVCLSSWRIEKPSVMFSQADLNIIDSAENQDGSVQGLASKNDDGHTKMWNAQPTRGSKAHPVQAVKSHERTFQGMPRFFAHSTGYVQDIDPVSPGPGLFTRSMANENRRALMMKASLQAPTTTLLSNSNVRSIEKWETAMLKGSFPDSDANPRAALKDEARTAKLAAGLKKMAQLAKTQKLWNAAQNDEITVANIGHLHPSDIDRNQRRSPEWHAAATHAHITSRKEMSYHPMKWLQEQNEPSAVNKPNKRTAKLSGVFTKLWNAAADDTIGGNPSIDTDPAQIEYHPRAWLVAQKDPVELGIPHNAAHRHASGRLFEEKPNHVRNFEGSYVDDNSIGIKVDALKQVPGDATMLADAGVVFGKKPSTHTDGIVFGHFEDKPLVFYDAKDSHHHHHAHKKTKLVEHAHTHSGPRPHPVVAQHPVAAHDTVAPQAGKRVEVVTGAARGATVQFAKHEAAQASHQGIEMGQQPVKMGHMLSSDKPNGLKTEDELVAELDDLRDQAMSAYSSLPDNVSPVVRGIATDDYDMVVNYLDSVASAVTGIERGNVIANFTMAHQMTVDTVKKVGAQDVVEALREGVGRRFTNLKADLDGMKKEHRMTTGDRDGEKQAMVLKALSDACDSAAEILSNPAYAVHEAFEDGAVQQKRESHHATDEEYHSPARSYAQRRSMHDPTPGDGSDQSDYAMQAYDAQLDGRSDRGIHNSQLSTREKEDEEKKERMIANGGKEVDMDRVREENRKMEEEDGQQMGANLMRHPLVKHAVQ